MNASIKIKEPQWLQVKHNNRQAYGYNQEWYSTEWQRLSGCGPTTATQVLTYAAFRDGYLNPSEYDTADQAAAAMEKMWPYVRPRHGGGLYKTRWFEQGVRQFIDDNDLPYDVNMFRVYPFKVNRPNPEKVAEFIARGLESDSPVAFLNRNRGNEQGLETWHWVPIVGLEQSQEEFKGIVYDDEQRKEFSLNNWIKDTTLGGGFVYVSKKK